MRVLTTLEHQKQQSWSNSSCLLTHCGCHLQLTVEPHPLQSMVSYSLILTQQKVMWLCFSVAQALSQGKRWYQCVGVMVSRPPPRRCFLQPQTHTHIHIDIHRGIYTHTKCCTGPGESTLQCKIVRPCFSRYYNYWASLIFFAGTSNERSTIPALCSTSVAITAVVSCAASVILEH